MEIVTMNSARLDKTIKRVHDYLNLPEIIHHERRFIRSC